MFARLTSFLLAALLLSHTSACMDRDKGKTRPKAKAAQTERDSPRSAASALGAQGGDSPDEPLPMPKRKAFDREHPLLSFAGFSKDGKRFVYAYQEPKAGAVAFLRLIEPDAPKAKPTVSLDPEYMDSIKEAEAFIKEGGYEAKRERPPGDLQIQAELMAEPPYVTLKLGKKSKRLDVGAKAYPDQTIAIVWGLSPDKKSVAIAIGAAPKGSGAGEDAGAMGNSLPMNAQYWVAKLPE